jgi:polar amino acid transport system substrate-binding protein
VPQRCRHSIRLACLALALATGFAAGCGGLRSKPPSRGLTHITDTGELRVGMSGEQPPLNMTARNGELIGMEVALVRVLAQSMGVRAVIVRRPFGQLLDTLDAGEVDIVMSGMAITPERSARVAMVGPYYTSGKALLTRSESLAAVQVPEDLNRTGLEIAALEGSTSEAFVRDSLPHVELVLAPRLEDGVRKVIDGEVDALLADKETCQFAVLRHPDAGLHASVHTFTVEPMGIAVPQDQPHLASLLQSYLTALANSGRLQKLRTYWFEDPSWVKQLR